MTRWVQLTETERAALLGAAIYFRDDADPEREGDMKDIPSTQWKALGRAIRKLK